MSMTFGEQIKSERKRLGLTQAGAAKKLGYSKASVEKWERGLVTPKPLTQVGILTLLSWERK
jgi:transcriptional regulator with XRE-family HTH domain